MSEPFNPYHAWLGIPPDEQPANHYRLLGLRIFETDADVISNASDQRMAYLRSLQIGKHRSQSQALLNEVSAATACLLNEAKRAKYDEQLRQELAKSESPPPAAPSDDIPIAPPLPVAQLSFSEPSPDRIAPSNRGVFITAMLVCLGLLLTIVVVVNSGSRKPEVPRNASQAPAERNSPVPNPALETSAEKPTPAVLPPSEPQPLLVQNPEAKPVQVVDQTAPPTPVPVEKPNPPQLFPLPDEETLRQAEAWLQATYATELADARSPQQQSQLAEQLLAEAAPGTDAARVHAQLEQARNLQIAAGEVPAALSTAESLARIFSRDEQQTLRIRLATYRGLADSSLSGPARELLSDRLLAEADAAVQRGEFATADDCSRLTLRVTRNLAGPERKRLAAQQRSRILHLTAQLATFEQALATLATNPIHPEANLTAGKFLCSVRGNWQQGRAYLAKGSDPGLASLMSTDQIAENASAGEQGASLQLAAADAWFDWAATATQADDELVALARSRALHWYQLSVSELKGLHRTKAERRLRELNPLPAVVERTPEPAKAEPPPTKVAEQPQPAPGLSGLIYVDNVPQPVLVRYLPGCQITVAELDELLKDLRQPKQRVRIVLEGTLRVATAGDYEIEISGGSASGGIHHLTFRGNREISVGDDLFKVDQRRFRLAAGDYPLQWELTGGELGSARLEIRPLDSAAEGTPPVVKLDPQKFVALQKQTKSERTIGQPRGK